MMPVAQKGLDEVSHRLRGEKRTIDPYREGVSANGCYTTRAKNFTHSLGDWANEEKSTRTGEGSRTCFSKLYR